MIKPWPEKPAAYTGLDDAQRRPIGRYITKVAAETGAVALIAGAGVGVGGILYVQSRIPDAEPEQPKPALRYGDKLCAQTMRVIRYGGKQKNAEGEEVDPKVREGTREGIYLDVQAFNDRNQDGVQQQSEPTFGIKVANPRVVSKGEGKAKDAELMELLAGLYCDPHFAILPHPPEYGMCLVAKDPEGNLIVPLESVQHYADEDQRKFVLELMGYRDAITQLQGQLEAVEGQIGAKQAEMAGLAPDATDERRAVEAELRDRRKERGEYTSELARLQHELDRSMGDYIFGVREELEAAEAKAKEAEEVTDD